jgi:hypothetical protein
MFCVVRFNCILLWHFWSVLLLWFWRLFTIIMLLHFYGLWLPAVPGCTWLASQIFSFFLAIISTRLLNIYRFVCFVRALYHLTFAPVMVIDLVGGHPKALNPLREIFLQFWIIFNQVIH